MDIYYVACGTIKQISDGKKFRVSGSMVIDDTLRSWGGSSDEPAPPATLPLEYLQYSYFISHCSLNVYHIAEASEPASSSISYVFSNAVGAFYMERLSLNSLGDLMWFLINGTGDWSEWTGESFSCFTEDLVPFDLFNEMNTLAPVIRLTQLEYLTNDPVFESQVICDIVLTKVGPADTGTRPSAPTNFRVVP